MFQDIPLKGFTAWFEDLASIAESAEDISNLPRLELLLRTGHTIRGVVAKAKKIDYDYLLMVAESPEAGSQGDVIFLSSAEVAGLRVLNFNRASGYFRKTLPPREVGSLELKRALKGIESQLEKYFDNSIPLKVSPDSLNEQTRGDLLNLLEILPLVFQSLTADTLGRKLVNEQIKEIEVNTADKAETVLKDNKLTILTNSSRTKSINEEKQRLKSEIENLL